MSNLVDNKYRGRKDHDQIKDKHTNRHDGIIFCYSSVGDNNVDSAIGRVAQCDFENCKLLWPDSDVAFHEVYTAHV